MGNLPPNKHVRVGRHKAYVRLRGKVDQKRPVYVLVHGIGMSHRYFKPFEQCLIDKNITVMTIDLPGFGRASRPIKALSIRDQAKLITEVISRFNIAKPVLIGQSMGCQFVTEVLCAYPDIADKAVLLGPTVNIHERTLAMQSWRLAQDCARESAKANWYVLSDYARAMYHHALTLRHMLSYPIEIRLPSVRAQLLIIRGSQDPIVPHQWVEGLAGQTERVQIKEIDGAPHLAHITHSQIVAESIIKFVAA